MSSHRAVQDRKNRRVYFTGFGSVMVGVLVFLLFFGLNFKTVEVKGSSMEPTFQAGNRLLMTKAYWLVGTIQIDDIVVIREPISSEIMIKRVKGFGGDVLDFKLAPRDWTLSRGEYRVPDGKYYLLGDNRAESQDSRDYGAIDESDVLGKVVVFGKESWVYGILGFSIFTIVLTGIGTWFDGRSKRKMKVDS